MRSKILGLFIFFLSFYLCIPDKAYSDEPLIKQERLKPSQPLAHYSDSIAKVLFMTDCSKRIQTLLNASLNLTKSKDHQKAILCLNEIRVLNKKEQPLLNKLLCDLYVENFKQQGSYDSAFFYLNILYKKQLNDLQKATDENIQFINRINSQEIHLETFKEQELELKLKSKNQNILLAFLYTFIFLTLALAVFLIVLLRNRKRIMAQTEKINRISKEMEQVLKQKELLFHEMQHRVKNNLTMLISLLEMQLEEIGSSEAIESYEKAISRIRSMALVHEGIYQQNEKSLLNLKLFVGQLFHHYLMNAKDEFLFEFDCDNITLSPGRGIKVGLLLNELILNSIQHASYDNKQLKISFSAKKIDDTYLLKFQDNGKGISDFKLQMENGKIGMFIINSMCKQLRATLKYESNPGASFTIFIPKI